MKAQAKMATFANYIYGSYIDRTKNHFILSAEIKNENPNIYDNGG